MDRVRDLVAACGVSVVLAQDRDRIAREPAYHYLLRKEFEAGRRDASLRLQLADVIAMAGRSKEAVPIYVGLADEFARSGHAPKAIAILKKIDKISPGRSDVANRLAALIGDHGKGAASAPPPADAMPDLEPARSLVSPDAFYAQVLRGGRMHVIGAPPPQVAKELDRLWKAEWRSGR